MNKILPIAIALLLSACSSDNAEDLFPPQDTIPADQEISFAVNVKPILAQSCTFSVCHGGGTGIPGNWNNYVEIKTRVDNGTFNIKVLDPGFSMPKGDTGALAPSKRAILRRWVAEGAKNN